MKKSSPPKKHTREHSRKGLQCYECHEFDHIASEYTNKKNKFKKKAMTATWKDESDELSDDSSSEDESSHT